MLTDEGRALIWSTANDYSDVKEGTWYNNAISTMTKGAVINGYPDGTFKPNKAITRAEFATIAVRFYKDDTKGPNIFSDVEGHWAEDYILKAVEQNLITGYEKDGIYTFKPNQNITRAEAMAIVNRVLERRPDKDHFLPDMLQWTDNMDTGAWYYEDVQEATNSHEYERIDEGLSSEYEKWTKILPVRDWAALERAWSTP